ncbi:MAG: carbon-nitrogen hydrolase family protein [Anaerolineaceae bacterium]|nr:carbon-nitrogen hydrolase family protein [Anaerolineaceae bacterium]
MTQITVSILQDQYTAQPPAVDETLSPPQLRRACAAYKEASIAPQLGLARQAVQQGAGLIVFREDCNGAGNPTLHRLDRPDLLAAMAEPIPGGPTSECLAQIARDGSCYVLGCFLETLGERFYNTAVLFSPSGKIAGKYHKTHLPPVEQFLLTPGDDLPVFDTEIGRVGILICYDMMTPEVMRCLALKGADLVCWPSLGYGWWDEAGDFTIRSRAHDNHVYLLGALPTHSCIVDPYGDVLASAGMETLTLIQAEINPGTDPLQDPLHTNTFVTQTPSLRERHLFERRPELYGTLVTPEPDLMQRYPQTHMRDMAIDKHKVFQHYRSGWGKLHWQTRKDRLTH